MYAASGGPNVKWGGTDVKWGVRAPLPPPLATDLSTVVARAVCMRDLYLIAVLSLESRRGTL